MTPSEGFLAWSQFLSARDSLQQKSAQVADVLCVSRLHMTVESGGLLNSAQERRLRITCEYVDKLLSDVENSLHSTESKSPFPKYIPDISPLQRKTIEDFIARIRARLVSALDAQNIEHKPPFIPLSRSIHAAATFMDIAIHELRPKYMRGYGELQPGAESELNGIVGELAGIVSKLDQVLLDSESGDLAGRLKKLEQAGEQSDILQVLERVISERRLVEFRSTLSMIIDRLEDNRFEIAVFGRVSSGKSSLLNHILGSPVLPVGVTPITAVPIRILYGDTQEVDVWRANMPMEVVPIAQLAQFVSEKFNPGNQKRVARINVRLPASRLSDGVMFVDTPGLGSLASHGAQETMSYMPRCDLGVVLIDAGSTFSRNDLDIIRALYELGIPSQVLLSKADLLDPDDQRSMITYIKEHLNVELGLDLHVRPVSALAEHVKLLDSWFTDDIAPLFNRRMELKSGSLQRKIGALRNSVIATLRLVVRRSSAESGGASNANDIESQLRQATAAIEKLDSQLMKGAEHAAEFSKDLLEQAARQLVHAWQFREEMSPSLVVADSIQLQFNNYVHAIQAEISSTEKYVVDVLRASATSLGLDGAPDEAEFMTLAREMPTFDPGRLEIEIKRPLALLASESIAVHQVAAKLHRELGSQLETALGTHSSLLKDWLQRLMRQIKQTFQSHADTYRAQLDRERGDQQLSPSELDAIRRDLTLLGERSEVAAD
jgi:GTP-binding protein EngB required for normal cell division